MAAFYCQCGLSAGSYFKHFFTFFAVYIGKRNPAHYIDVAIRSHFQSLAVTRSPTVLKFDDTVVDILSEWNIVGNEVNFSDRFGCIRLVNFNMTDVINCFTIS